MGKISTSLKESAAAFTRRPKQMDLETYLAKLLEKGLTPDGKEISDPVPLGPPIGYKKQPSMVEIVRDMVRGERLREAALSVGQETFEESEDFDVGDENAAELRSGYENDFDPPIAEIAKEVETNRAKKKPSTTASPAPAKPPEAPPPPDGHPDTKTPE